MNRKQLEDYHNIVVRLHELKTGNVTDTVIGSSEDYPYTSHPVTLHGVRGDDKTVEEINLLEQKKSTIDAYIDGIEDVRAKTLLDLHNRKGWSWCKVAHTTGKRMEANKKYLKRFWKCPLLSPCDPLK